MSEKLLFGLEGACHPSWRFFLFLMIPVTSPWSEVVFTERILVFFEKGQTFIGYLPTCNLPFRSSKSLQLSSFAVWIGAMFLNCTIRVIQARFTWAPEKLFPRKNISKNWEDFGFFSRILRKKMSCHPCRATLGPSAVVLLDALKVCCWVGHVFHGGREWIFRLLRAGRVGRVGSYVVFEKG